MAYPGFIKRLIVICYDSLLLGAILLFTFVPLHLILGFIPLATEYSNLVRALKVLYLLSITFVFYGWFWTHGGQTLGLKAWRLYIINDDNGKFIGWRKSLLRFAAACLSWLGIAPLLYAFGISQWYLGMGLGFLWILAHPQGKSWHDLLSKSRIVYQAK